MRKIMTISRILAILTFSLVPCFGAEDKPNFLFIFADDFAYDAIGCYGNDEVKTPHLDALAARGKRFTHTYNQGGYHGAVCVASRSMLVSGQYLWHVQAKEKELRSKLQEEGQLWPQLLASVGYDTYFTGKWHVKADADKIFKEARHVRPGMPNQTPAGYNRPIDGQPDPWDPTDPKFEGFWKGGRHWSEIVADDCLDYLNTAKASENPFFMYIAFNAPHDPRQSPKKYVDMYPIDKISLPQPFYPEYAYKDDIGCSAKLRDEKLAPFPRTARSVKVNRAEYYAIITHLDDQVGRILEGLKATGKEDSTYIVFTADHGLGCGHHSLLGKQNMFDHSVRVPFFVSGPGIKANTETPARIYLQDVMPTTLELAGVAKPERVQFQSLLPILRGEKDRSRDAIYGAYTMLQRMVTVGDYKLIIYPKIGKRLLFNLRDDPTETHDLATDPTQKWRVPDMEKTLKALQKETGDPLVIEAAPQGV
ncbi:MAG: arylsulfatase A-like enzyme [Verrucomicrobiales bacterium]